MSTISASYFHTVFYDYSRAIWIYLIAEKTEVATILKEFFDMVNSQFHQTVKIVRSDNGIEFLSLKPYFL